MIRTGIKAVDYYVPEKVVTNDDLSTIVETNDEWIASRTGIRRRHLSTGENTSEFCIEVGKKLLSKTNTNPEDIDLIIVTFADIIPDSFYLIDRNISGNRLFMADSLNFNPTL